MKQAKAFYRDKKWQRKRLYILRRDGYKCQESKRYGQYSEATTVHHIYPLEDYPEIAFEDWNLIVCLESGMTQCITVLPES